MNHYLNLKASLKIFLWNNNLILFLESEYSVWWQLLCWVCGGPGDMAAG